MTPAHRSRHLFTVAFLTLLAGACEDSVQLRELPSESDTLQPEKLIPDGFSATDTTHAEDTRDDDTLIADATTQPQDTRVEEDTRVGEDAPIDLTADTGQPDATSNLDACLDACALADERIDQCFGGNTLERDGAQRDPASFLLARDSLAFARGDATEADLERTARDLGATLSASSDNRVVVFDGASRTRIRELSHEIPGLGRELPTLATATTGRRVIATERFVIRFHPTLDPIATLEQAGARVVRPLAFGHHGYIGELTDTSRDVFDVTAELAARSDVRYAQPDLLRSYARRSDPLYPLQWHLDATDDNGAAPSSDIMASEAWTLVQGNPESRIAINDDGVDIEHPDLEPNIVDVYNPPRNLERTFRRGWASHGTSVAGVAAARGDNDQGVSGVCPGCGILPIFSNLDLSDDSSIAESFTWPADRGAAAINNSWGPADGDPTIAAPNEGAEPEPLARVVEEAIQYAETEGRGGLGTVLVFAAGNGNESTDSDPFVSHPLTVGVAATDDRGRKAWYSDFGPGVHVAAPSNGGLTTGIVTTDIRSQYGYNPGDRRLGDPQGDYTNDFGGTSSATPVVSGVIGLVSAANPALTAAQIRDLLRDTADPIDPLDGQYTNGISPFYGTGRVNAYRAVRAALALLPDAPCTPLEAELCNGLDDTCDGQTDEGCEAAPSCSACTQDAECGAGARCALTPHDASPRCVPELPADGACPDGFSAQDALCIPDDGRCDPCLDAELCNGLDDTCDGQIDEGAACPRVSPGDDCDFDAQCASGSICAGETCTRPCNEPDDCGDPFYTCAPHTPAYSVPEPENLICGYFEPACADLRCNNHNTNQRAWLIRCLQDAGSSCEAVAYCVYGF